MMCSPGLGQSLQLLPLAVSFRSKVCGWMLELNSYTDGAGTNFCGGLGLMSQVKRRVRTSMFFDQSFGRLRSEPFFLGEVVR